jgi:Uma2 family endonuclease
MSALLIPPDLQRRLRVDEYHRMIGAGVFDDDERLELLEGVIVGMSPQSVLHARVIQYLVRLFARGLADPYVVRPQLPLTLGDDGEPEPDLAIVTVDEACAPGRHPTQALLVIEVANESLAKDRGLKAAIYARGGVAEYWIVNLVEQTLEVYLEPQPGAGRYGASATYRADAAVAPRFAPELTLRVAEVLAG